VQGRRSIPSIAFASSGIERCALSTMEGSCSASSRRRWRARTRPIGRFEDPAADEDSFGTQFHHQRGVAGVETPPAQNSTPAASSPPRRCARVRAVRRDRARERRVPHWASPRAARCRRGSRAYAAPLPRCCPNLPHPCCGSSPRLRAIRRSASEVARAADEGHGEAVLFEMIEIVGRVSTSTRRCSRPRALEADAPHRCGRCGPSPSRDRDGILDAGDQLGMAHPRDAAVSPNIGRNPLERHDGNRARFFGHLGLLGRDDVHNDAALSICASPRFTVSVPVWRRPRCSIVLSCDLLKDGNRRKGPAVALSLAPHRSGSGRAGHSSRRRAVRATPAAAAAGAACREPLRFGEGVGLGVGGGASAAASAAA